MPEIKSAQCHCGAVTFNVTLLDGFNSVRRCNCSYCRMRGAVVAFASEINVTQGEDKLTEYRFNSKSVAHYFCSVCGVYTFHQPRSNPQQRAVNVACIDGISPFDFSPLNVTNGIDHPKDGGKGGVAGTLIYQPSDDGCTPD